MTDVLGIKYRLFFLFSCIEAPEILGDLDNDDVDRDDLDILLPDRGQSVAASACGEACDLDEDGEITALDARKLVVLCTRPGCVTEQQF